MSDEAQPGRKARSGSETRQRGALIGFRATKAELAEIDMRAERAGLSRSSFVRAATLAAPQTRAQRRPSVERQLLAQLVAYMGRAAGSLYQIARHLNFGNAEASADVEAALVEVRAAVASVMAMTGQQPREAVQPKPAQHEVKQSEAA